MIKFLKKIPPIIYIMLSGLLLGFTVIFANILCDDSPCDDAVQTGRG